MSEGRALAARWARAARPACVVPMLARARRLSGGGHAHRGTSGDARCFGCFPEAPAHIQRGGAGRIPHVLFLFAPAHSPVRVAGLQRALLPLPSLVGCQPSRCGAFRVTESRFSEGWWGIMSPTASRILALCVSHCLLDLVVARLSVSCACCCC